MLYKLYQVDAFTNKLFSGNPAAVCPLNEWLSDDIMQKIAMENNLAETAFYVKQYDHYLLRWFTPKVEVDLCGHATLAAAFVIFNIDNYNGDLIKFLSHRSGELTVARQNDYLALNFPADFIEETQVPDDIIKCFDTLPKEAYRGKTDLLLVFESEGQIRNLKVDFTQLAKLDYRGVIASSKGDSVDFVSRFFAPQVGINEDPVTGSAHTTLAPFWADRLGKKQLTAMQLSERSGYLECTVLGDRVEIKGQGRLYMEGKIFLENY